MKILISLVLLLSASAFSAPSIKPKFQDVSLVEFTSLEIDLMPDAGTQLIFPFKLDNPALTPEIKITLTNNDGFTVPTSSNELEATLVGQNTITVMSNVSQDPNDIYVGNLFITIGGYHITISLRTSYNVTKHTTNYVFRLGDDERNYLIENAVKNRVKELEDNYRKKLDELDSGGGKNMLVSLSKIAKIRANRDSIKHRLKFKINGSKVQTDLISFTKWGGKYGTLDFVIRNLGGVDLDVSNISFYGTDKTGTEMLIDGEYSCADVIESDSKAACIFATRDTGVMDYKSLKFVLGTAQGTGEAKW